MPNTSVFTGADGSLSLSTNGGAEGAIAKDVLKQYDMINVGRVQDVRVEVHTEVRPFNEIGQRYPTELRPGNVTIKGTIGRAYLNGAMLNLLLGEAKGGRPVGSWSQPAFNITLMVQNPAQPDFPSTIQLNDVKIEDWVVTMPEDDFVMESVSFQALYVTGADGG
jgi:hypothetical protein